MKKILFLSAVTLFMLACNNAPDSDAQKDDSLNMNAGKNTDTRADQVPADNTISKDTSSYERMSTRPADSIKK